MKTRALIRPTDLLRCEHATILTTLEKLETLAADASRGTQLRDERAWGVTSFLVSYLQNFHLEKEDHLLFPALRDAGMPADDGPLQGLKQEHEAARVLLREMVDEVGNGLNDPSAFARASHSLIDLMRAHIRKENGALFIAAEDLLDEGAKLELLQAFRARGTHGPFVE